MRRRVEVAFGLTTTRTRTRRRVDESLREAECRLVPTLSRVPTPTTQHRRVSMVLAAETTLAIGVGVWQLLGLSSGSASRPEVALGSSTYFVLVGLVLAALAVAAWRGARWVYGPAVFVQVIALPLAATMATEGLWIGTVLLGGAAGLGLWLLVGPDGRSAFDRSRLDQG